MDELIIIVIAVTITLVLLTVVTGILLYYKRRNASRKKQELLPSVSPGISVVLQPVQPTIKSPILEHHHQPDQPIPFTLPPTSVPRSGSIGNLLRPSTITGSRRNSFDVTERELGTLDPTLYSDSEVHKDTVFPSGNIGRVWFAIEYEHEFERLRVTVQEVKNLPPKGSTPPDVVIRVQLLPDARRYIQSKIKKKTRDAVFDESFIFQVPSRSIQQRTLRLSVYDVDRYKRQHLVGHVMYPLAEHTWCNDGMLMWRDLDKHTTLMSETGEILVTLCYNNSHSRLTVCLYETKHVLSWPLAQSVQHIDCYAKVALLVQNKLVKSKRSSTQRVIKQPVFADSFVFSLSPDLLNVASVCISLHQNSHGSKDRLLGRLVLGPYMFARGTELEHWNEMSSRPKESVKKWHSLAPSH